MKKWVYEEHQRYALAAIAIPAVTILTILIHQAWEERNLIHSSPGDIRDNEIYAAAMMAIADMITIVVWSSLALLLGLVLAIISVRKQRAGFGIGTMALLLNALPFIGIAAMMIWSRL